MKILKQAVGWVLLIAGSAGLILFAIIASRYRYEHETLTETQLQLWSFDHWYGWVLPLLGIGLGVWLTGILKAYFNGDP
jgi:hypothetical protein